MSFASNVKKELTMLEVHPEHAKAELAALIRMNGTLEKVKNTIFVSIQTENASIARRVFSLIKSLFDVKADISVRRRMKLNKNNVYFIRLNKEAKRVLMGLEIYEAMLHETHIPDSIKKNDQKIRSYLRGAFLARGSVNSPETSSYHLEIHSTNEAMNQDIYEMIDHLELNPKMHQRKNGGYMTYLKEAEKISDFLGTIGANNGLFVFEDVRIVRDMRNSVNRLVNCEQANLNKTVDAATRQIEAILLIDREMGLSSLPDKIQETANLRLEYPEASLKELGELVPNKPISKSAVNHRMRKLMEIAEDFQKTKV